MATQSRPAAVPQLLHGVPCRCPDAGPPDQERPARAAEDGRQLPQASGRLLHLLSVLRPALLSAPHNLFVSL